MPAVLSSSRNLTLYAQVQTDARTIPNTTGVWTSTGAQRVRFNTFNIAEVNPVNTPQYKTGKRSPLIGVRGRQSATFTLNKPFIPSGAAGTVPDDDPILQSIFGQAGTVVASTSVTYSLADTLKYLSFMRYNKSGGTSPTNAYLMGAIPQQVKFTGGGNFLDYELQGMAVGYSDSVNFAAYTGGDLARTGTLTTFPAEPTISTNGNIIAGFGAGAGFKIGGSSLAEVRGTVDITMSMGVDSVSDALNDPYTVGFIGGLRQISISQITCIDSDNTVLNTLKQAAFTKSVQTLSLQFGSVAGSIVTFNLNNVQVGSMSWQESGAALNIQFGQSDAHATSVSVTDDATLVVT